jgi:UDP-N-acetylmuramyl pentapeptide phosphotransferase/UDP-N-acetylglucosamine-1-phosphate transferase
MNFIYFNIFLFFILILLNNFLLKKNFLLNYSGQDHQIFTEKNKIPLSGGFIILIFLNYQFFNYNLLLVFFINILFLVGLFADINIIKSPSIRFFLQLILILSFIFFLDLSIENIRINFFNKLLLNTYFNLFFASFCLLVLINGSNFIDGNNTLSIGYYILILLVIYKLKLSGLIVTELGDTFFLSFLITLLTLYFFNLLNQLYLGDNGIYILALIFGYLLIKIYSLNNNISPYFIVNLLWYPAFEILFSLIRKIKSKLSPLEADTFHLHQLIYFFLKKKFPKKNIFTNSLTGNLINAYNLILFYCAHLYIHSSNTQVFLLVISLVIYIFIYFTFYNIRKRN